MFHPHPNQFIFNLGVVQLPGSIPITEVLLGQAHNTLVGAFMDTLKTRLVLVLKAYQDVHNFILDVSPIVELKIPPKDIACLLRDTFVEADFFPRRLISCGRQACPMPS